MCARFTLEDEEDRIAKEDYYATLQYLISEAKDFGVESGYTGVVRTSN